MTYVPPNEKDDATDRRDVDILAPVDAGTSLDILFFFALQNSVRPSPLRVEFFPVRCSYAARGRAFGPS